MKIQAFFVLVLAFAVNLYAQSEQSAKDRFPIGKTVGTIKRLQEGDSVASCNYDRGHLIEVSYLKNHQDDPFFCVAAGTTMAELKETQKRVTDKNSDDYIRAFDELDEKLRLEGKKISFEPRPDGENSKISIVIREVSSSENWPDLTKEEKAFLIGLEQKYDVTITIEKRTEVQKY